MAKNLFTKDNFWNLMFWVGIVLAVSISELLSNISGTLSLICIVLSILFLPSRLAKLNNVLYNEDKIFLNSQGDPITERLPASFGIVIFVNLLVSGIIISRNFNEISVSTITAIIFTLPTLYFILINCPISILFNENAWSPKIIGLEINKNIPISTSCNGISANSNLSSSLNNFMRENPITDARWSGSSSNIHNPNRR